MDYIINDYFKEQYLCAGATRDNYIFTGCPKEIIGQCFYLLNKENNDTKPLTIKIDRALEKQFEELLDQCQDNFSKTILSRDLINSLIAKKAYDYMEKDDHFATLDNTISILLSGDLDKAKKNHINCVTQEDIKDLKKKLGKFEINFFLIDTQNIPLQRAINNYIYSREPYSVKIFSTGLLPSYTDEAKNFIESPHDYISININAFLEPQDEPEME